MTEKEIRNILRQDPAFRKGRRKMMTIEAPKGTIETISMDELGDISPGKPTTGWLKPEHDVYKCLMCDLSVCDPHNRKMNKCPVCGFEMIQVDAIGLLKMGNEYHFMTEPN